MEYYMVISITVINILWSVTTWQRRRIYKIEREKLINWLDEVPEFWDVPKDLWEIETKRIAAFLRMTG